MVKEERGIVVKGICKGVSIPLDQESKLKEEVRVCVCGGGGGGGDVEKWKSRSGPVDGQSH